jgi:hypothetical protein
VVENLLHTNEELEDKMATSVMDAMDKIDPNGALQLTRSINKTLAEWAFKRLGVLK